MTGSWQSHRQAMKNGQRSPKWRWKDASGRNLVAIASCTALISMFSAVFVSILWETYNQPPKATNSTGNKTAYRYPVYKLNFKKVLKDRENLAEVYGYKLNSAQVERRSDLSLQEFFDLYDGKWPVLVTDVVSTWPAFKKWTRDFFNKTYGEQRVVMKAVKGTLTDAESLSLPLFAFIEHTGESDTDYWTYAEDELFITTRPELRKDVHTTIYTEEDFFQQFPEDIRPWDCMLLWGTAHSRSLLHMDPYNWTGTNAVLWGTKKWKLFPPGQDHLLYAIYPEARPCGFPLECHKYGSPMDAFGTDWELKQYPRFKLARYLEVDQKAGEMLFIPTGWFHQAYNSEETLAVSGQMMNRNNFRFVLEEILKAGNLPRKLLPEGFHNLLPPDQVRIFMSLLPKKLLKKGRDLTNNYLSQLEKGLK